MISLIYKYKKMFCLIVLFCLIPIFISCKSIAFSTPYKVINENAELKKEYIIAVTFAEVRDDKLSKTKFKKYLSNILDSMEEHNGLHGYSVRKQLFGNKAWTYSIWEQEEFVKRFKSSDYHKPAMRESDSILEKAKFARKRISSNELPFSWEKALFLLQSGDEVNY